MDEVLKLLSVMREENLEPDDFTFASILVTCSNTIIVELGRQVHSLILKSYQKMDATVANALITMYIVELEKRRKKKRSSPNLRPRM